jgi:aconitate hydratase
MFEIPFVVARVLLQDFTGVPLGVDLAAMRSAMARLGRDPAQIEPLVPVDLVIDHSVQVDYFGDRTAYDKNLDLEFSRNAERYRFLKWCANSFSSFKVMPPGMGICHQANLEFLAPGVFTQNGVCYPDSLVGTDSHTTMINGLSVIGWGVGGIEAEAAMLGQPIYFLTPDVIGIYLTGELSPGVMATDLVLTVTEILRRENVVGKFVEFFGPGAANLSVPDRATISNMAPEYGATIGIFPADERTCTYLSNTGRSESAVKRFRDYFTAQGMFGTISLEDVDYTKVIPLDLNSIVTSVAGPKRPQDRHILSGVKEALTREFKTQISSPTSKGTLKFGDVVIAAITSCTNTSNPTVMVAAGLLAKKAVELGLKVPPFVKTSLAPGSRIVAQYLHQIGVQTYLDELGFQIVGYGCTTCIGNSGPLHKSIESEILERELVVASVLSGNRNFEARVHPSVKANFLMSPPLVVAYALAGNMLIDLTIEPLSRNGIGKEIYLRDIWPSATEVASAITGSITPADYIYNYSAENVSKVSPQWEAIEVPLSTTFQWETNSSYIRESPFFLDFSPSKIETHEVKDIIGGRILALFGDSITTDHISPAGRIEKDSPAGLYLQDEGVPVEEFNSYGSRRGNHEIMVRGTFANVRIKNLLLSNQEGGYAAIFTEDGKGKVSQRVLPIYDVAELNRTALVGPVPLIVFAGQEYGSGSSRDWAAKGPKLLGISAVIAESFERIHRSNLIGMGILPLSIGNGQRVKDLNLVGTEIISIFGIAEHLAPKKELIIEIKRVDGSRTSIPAIARFDTSIEVAYYKAGGILPYVLNKIM